MYSKALKGFKAVVGADDSRSRSLRDKLHALDNVTKDESIRDVGESRRHKLFRKLGIR